MVALVLVLTVGQVRGHRMRFGLLRVKCVRDS